MKKSNSIVIDKIKEIDHLIGLRIKLARQACGITQMQLAEKLDVSYQQVQKYETGLNRVSGGCLIVLGKLLNKPLEYFFDQNQADTQPIENSARLMRVARSWNSLDDANQLLVIKLIESLCGGGEHANN